MEDKEIQVIEWEDLERECELSEELYLNMEVILNKHIGSKFVCQFRTKSRD